MADTTTLTTHDDPVTAQLMDGINEARILLASHEHRQDLAEIAKISNEMIKLDARRTELQDAIGKRNKVYLAAEEALGAHLSKKHAFVPVAQAAADVVSRVFPEPDPLPNWPRVDPDLLDGSVYEAADKRYVATNGVWVEEV